jgi:hypothetical protein
MATTAPPGAAEANAGTAGNEDRALSGRDTGAPAGRLLGDSLVPVQSATGRGKTRRIAFAEEDGHHVGGTHHLALLNHPEVSERLCERLAQPPPRFAGAP